MTTTRRNLFSAATAGLLIVKPETAFGTTANSAIGFGVIGTGNRGRYVAKYMAGVAGTRLTAVCDKYEDRLAEGRKQIPGGDNVEAYLNYEQLLARADVDAVLIATPIFLHPEHFAAAVAAGKHVYCEKAVGVDVAGVRKAQTAASKASAKQSMFWGFQQRFSPEYLEAERMLHAGELGDVSLLTSFWMIGAAAFLANGAPPKPANMDAMIRGWYNYRAACGDMIVEQDCHGIDVMNWYAGAHPLKASGDSGRKVRTSGDCNDHYNVTFEYARGLKGWLQAMQCGAGPMHDVREQVFGLKGTLEVARAYLKVQPANSREARRIDTKREITIDAVEAFFASIANAKPLNMTPQAADSTLTAILGRMACDLKRTVTWEEMLESN